MPYRTTPYHTVLYCMGKKLNELPIRRKGQSQQKNKICCTSSSPNLPFNMLIPSELGLKVKASPSSLSVSATHEDAANESYFGDRLDHFCSLLKSNRREASELLKAGRFTFKEKSLMVIFFLRVNPEETLLLDSMGSEVINSTGEGANKLK